MPQSMGVEHFLNVPNWTASASYPREIGLPPLPSALESTFDWPAENNTA
jgi:hypothetical protein